MPSVRFWCALVLAAASNAARAEGTYINRELGFRFTPPAGWQQKKLTNGGPGFVTAFVEGGGNSPALPARTESDSAFLQRVKGNLKRSPETGRVTQASISIVT